MNAQNIQMSTTNLRKVQHDLRLSLPEDNFEATVVRTDYGLLILDDTHGGYPVVAYAPDGQGFYFHYALVEDLASDLGVHERLIWESAARSKDRSKIYGENA